MVLALLCRQRGRGKPLQYILGTEFFGDLEIICKPGVLIPRRETAALVSHLVRLLTSQGRSSPLPRILKLLDLCTGTGCIPLLFQHDLCTRSLSPDIELLVTGVEISSQAVALAKRNLEVQTRDASRSTSPNPHYVESLRGTRFLRGNVMASRTPSSTSDVSPPLMEALEDNGRGLKWDILISNPPYISPASFRTNTARSVRRFEPRLALVPECRTDLSDIAHGDLFYSRLLEIASAVDAKLVLFEVADLQQAKRIASSALDQTIWDGVEIWRDEPSDTGLSEKGDVYSTARYDNVPIRGSGNGRAVFAWRGEAAGWLGLRPGPIHH